MESPKPILMIMARASERGRVKTRLEAAFGRDAALVLHTAMVEDTLELAKRCATAFRGMVVCWASAAGKSLPADWVRNHPEFRHMSQGEGSLGQRLARAFDRELVSGPVICIGTDSPTLPDEYLFQATREVGHGGAEVVFGPARDGGYYLIGLPATAPFLFEGIDWGTERVLAQSSDRAARHGWAVLLLPPWYDLDRPEDVSALVQTSNPAPTRGPRTTAAACRLFEGKPLWTDQKCPA